MKRAITPPVFDRSKLHRAQLVDRLHAAVEKSLVVVAAPAGYGKTTLLSDFTAHTDLRVCWVRLAPGQSEDISLAETIVASLQQCFRGAKRKAEPAGFSYASPPESTARVLSAWIEETLTETFVLALDDVHELVPGSRGLRFLDEFVRLRPNAVSTVVVGRSAPELSLARLMAEGQLEGIGPGDLAFTKEEVRTLVESLASGRQSQEEADQIYEASRGWVAGVILSATVSHSPLAEIGSQSPQLVYEYLSAVVLNRLPDDLREFVLAASVLPVMTPDLCDGLLRRSDSAAMLRQCLRKGLFIEFSGGDDRTYTFHDLFRTFLLETQSAKEANRYLRLRLRAATLLEKSGALEPAFQLLVEAGSHTRASLLAEQSVREMIRRGKVETVERWWQALRGRGVFIPETTLALSSVYMDRGEVSRANELAESIEAGLERGGSIRYPSRLLTLKAGIHFRRGEYRQAIRVSRKVLGSDDSDLPPVTRAIALETKALGLAALRIRLPEARDDAEQAFAVLASVGDTLGMVRALRNLGAVLEALGDNRALAATVEKALDLLGSGGPPTETAYALNNVANIRHKGGQFELALSLYRDALRSARQAAHSYLEALVLFGQADVFNDVGMPMQAAQLYGEGLAIATRIDNRYLIRYGCLQTGSLYRRRGNVVVGNEWIRRALDLVTAEDGLAAATLQIAGLEVAASPRNAAASLERLLKRKNARLSGEEEVHAKVLMTKATSMLGDQVRAAGFAADTLASAGALGSEQLVASELLADRVLRRYFETTYPGNPVLEETLARIEAMEAFRRTHSLPREEPAGATVLKVTALGQPQVTVEGGPLKGLKRQSREMLFLLVDRGTVSREFLSEVFWPRHPAGRQAANIHTAVHSIRAALGKSAVLLDGGVYSLDADLDVIYDVEKFEKAASVAERLPVGDPRKLFALNEAINLYGGQFLNDVPSLWATERRRQLEIRYLDLISEQALEALARDQPRRAIESLRRGLSVDPLRDDLNIRYLEALGRLGQVSEVSAHYLHYTRLIREELGIDPPEAIRELYARLIS